jgi:glutaredoxin-related protein
MQAIVWTKPGCGYCTSAKLLLKQKNIIIEERVLGSGWTKEQLLENVPTAKTLPQIFLDGDYVGGFTELKERLQNGRNNII